MEKPTPEQNVGSPGAGGKRLGIGLERTAINEEKLTFNLFLAFSELWFFTPFSRCFSIILRRHMVRGMPMSQVSVEPIELFLKAGAGADDELTHKVRIFRKCFNFLPWTILQFALSCTSRLVGTALSGSFVVWRCLSSSIHWRSLWWLSMESGSIFNCYFSSSVYVVVVDTKLFDPILPMCDKSSCLYQRISVPIVNYIYYGNYFFSICWIIL